MNIRPFVFLAVFCPINVYNSDAYRVLGIFHAGSKSHYHLGSALMAALAEKGHEVTLIAPFKLDKPVANLTEIYLDGYFAFMAPCNVSIFN